MTLSRIINGGNIRKKRGQIYLLIMKKLYFFFLLAALSFVSVQQNLSKKAEKDLKMAMRQF